MPRPTRLAARFLIAVILAAGGLAAGSAGPAVAQDAIQSALQGAPSGAPAPDSVGVTTLAAPDAFTTAARPTGLPPTLWRGASVKTVQAVLPLLAAKPLTPAGAALVRRVLATGAPGPKGEGADDAALAAARATALSAQGDPKAAAESALLSGDDARACSLEQGLSAGREDIYWLRLRTYCQAIGGRPDQAQLTFDLAQGQLKDPVFGRLMAAKINGAGNPGAASLRNGLDYALSRNLGLDLSAAKPAPAVAAAMDAADPAPPTFDPAAAPGDVAPLAELLSRGDPLPAAMMPALADLAGSTDPKARARGQAALLYAGALSGPMTAELRGQIAGLAVAEGKAPLGRSLALEAAGEQKLIGEAAMLSLWICAEAGAGGPALGDRVRIVRALHAVGLEADARAFALEGLLALK